MTGYPPRHAAAAETASLFIVIGGDLEASRRDASPVECRRDDFDDDPAVAR